VLIPGRRILPTGPREGIVVNIAEHRLYYYPKPKRHQLPQVITYPVSIGKMDWAHAAGRYAGDRQAGRSLVDSDRVGARRTCADGDVLPERVPPGPDNPLGNRALRLAAGKGTYLIHGTNNPIAVGLAVTHGCIRMYPEDIDALFEQVRVGIKVRIVNEPVKVAWVDGELLLEAHPPVDAEGRATSRISINSLSCCARRWGETTVAIHWDYAREVLARADGVLATVGLEAELPPLPAEAGELGEAADAVPAAPAAAPTGSSAEPAPASAAEPH